MAGNLEGVTNVDFTNMTEEIQQKAETRIEFHQRRANWCEQALHRNKEKVALYSKLIRSSSEVNDTLQRLVDLKNPTQEKPVNLDMLNERHLHISYNDAI